MTSDRPTRDLRGYVAVVTGASNGIGYETAKALASRGARTILACRNRDEAAKQALKERIHRELEGKNGDLYLEVMDLDLSSFEATKRFTEAFKAKDSPLHILVNNAGIAFVPYGTTVDGHEKHFQVNHLSPFLLTLELYPCLKRAAEDMKGAKVVIVTSNSHSSAEFSPSNTSGEQGYSRYMAYYNSKLYNIMFAYCLQRRVKNDGITVSCVHPGKIRSNIIQEPCRRSRLLKWISQAILASPLFSNAEIGADRVLHSAHLQSTSNPHSQSSDMSYYDKMSPTEPSKTAMDERCQKQLWEISLTSVKDHLSVATIQHFSGVSAEEDILLERELDKKRGGQTGVGEGGQGETEVVVTGRETAVGEGGRGGRREMGMAVTGRQTTV